ncbi:hypothetical protein [Pelagibius sp. Alg239-R121]|uniref:hypothetical protein n=1 Tax=Pelagibius sp. Alg239-R121 TaxID=2993448 RepID=UPI0024A77CE0|nr:hypothetical protein [Pelagibius sp. Alg239-R121]
MTYTSPIGFVNQLGGSVDARVDFNSFGVDAFFQNSSLDVGPLSFSSSGPAHNQLNKVEVSPVTFPTTAPNFTPYAGLYLQTLSGGSTTVTLTFDEPTRAFGANFREMDRSTVISYTTQLGSQSITPGISNGFFGFILETGQFVSSLMFSTPVADGFGIDNILISNASAAALPAKVNEPGTLSLMFAALLGLGILLRRSRHRS